MINPDHPTNILDLPERIPVFPLQGAMLLPRGRLPLNIFEARYLAMVRDAFAHGRLIAMIQPNEDDPDQYEPAIYPMGCLGRIAEFSETGDGRYVITLLGVCRFNVIEEISRDTPYRQVLADYAPFAADILPVDQSQGGFDRNKLEESLRAYVKKLGLSADWSQARKASDDDLVTALSMMLPFGPSEKQALLEAPDLMARAEVLTALLQMAAADDSETPVQ